MVEAPTNPPIPERSRPSRAAAIEGYLSLALVGVMGIWAVLRVQIPGAYGLIVGVVVWGLAWLFAISGMRRGQGGARAAAAISLAILVLHAGISLVIAYH